MVRTHIEYDDFGEFVESEDLEPVGIPLKKKPAHSCDFSRE